ncbi:NADPH:quinone reductase [Vagococcus penaei]|uniref:NADPH:quinone reductase n=1 Tax=Vagococcus penaei TaxID=633807 RepID=A0A1Q2D5V4_9ENTE|nr:acryloyl-CoA reductase [Vagococcus penaei]AQP53655.1 NADPH:quinone reductase [Vagococcus penaei]RST99234.1 NADPH:quinone reductase [Vagococcus penaei]
MDKFKALLLTKTDGQVQADVTTCDVSQLSEGDTLIKVSYSAINYKDALATKTKSGVIRHFPMIPGIDLAGEVIETTSDKLKVGDKVVVTGQGTGVSHTGGLSEIARIPSEWILPLPTGLSEKESMFFGTAGITAMHAIQRLEVEGLAGNYDTPVMVSGATGGVGSLAIILLASLGYKNIIAISRKEETVDYLKSIGATQVISPAELESEKKRPLEKQQVSYMIDTVGGALVENVLPKVNYGGAVALCGNASGIAFSTTVLPFILRGIALVGVDSVQLSGETKAALWTRISESVNRELLANLRVNDCDLTTILDTVSELLAGTHTGRTVVAVQ